MLIRKEQGGDIAAVHALHCAAFEQPAEADLVDALRASVSPLVSLVAEEDGVVVGHVLFSPVTLLGNPALKIIGLAPMAVLPARQNSGIGSKLVRAGLEECSALGFAAVVVLGHPDYYPRFGFVPASTFGIDSEYAVPDPVFMAMELREGALANGGGRVQYHPLFKDV